MNRPGPIEPTADLRQTANFQRQYYAALLAAGFTDDQAMRLLGAWIAAAMANDTGGEQ